MEQFWEGSFDCGITQLVRIILNFGTHVTQRYVNFNVTFDLNGLLLHSYFWLLLNLNHKWNIIHWDCLNTLIELLHVNLCLSFFLKLSRLLISQFKLFLAGQELQSQTFNLFLHPPIVRLMLLNNIQVTIWRSFATLRLCKVCGSLLFDHIFLHDRTLRWSIVIISGCHQ